MDCVQLRSLLIILFYCQFRLHLCHAVRIIIFYFGDHLHSSGEVSDKDEYDNWQKMIYFLL